MKNRCTKISKCITSLHYKRPNRRSNLKRVYIQSSDRSRMFFLLCNNHVILTSHNLSWIVKNYISILSSSNYNSWNTRIRFYPVRSPNELMIPESIWNKTFKICGDEANATKSQKSINKRWLNKLKVKCQNPKLCHLPPNYWMPIYAKVHSGQVTILSLLWNYPGVCTWHLAPTETGWT